jgi:Tfp pilus assembly protein PilF
MPAERLDPRATLRDAMDHVKAGRLREAADACQRIVRQHPHNAAAWHLIGVVALQDKRYEAALEALRCAVAADAKQAHYHSNLALAYRGLGRLAEAEGALGDALRVDPASAEIHNNRGTVLLELGRAADAEAAWRDAIRLQPRHADAHANLGTVMQRAARWDEAERALWKALELDPRHRLARTNLGLVYHAQQKWAEAEEVWRALLRVDPGSAEAHNALGALLFEQGRTLEAEGPLREAIRLKPAYAEALTNLGAVLVELDRAAEAEPSLREAVRLGPQSSKALNNLGVALQALERSTEADALFAEALRIKPDHARTLCGRGKLFIELGRLDDAEAQFREAIRHDPDNVAAYAFLAPMRLGKVADADRLEMERLLVGGSLRDASRSALHFALAHVYDAREDYATAAGHLRQANTLSLAAAALRGKAYDPTAHTRLVDRMIETFDAAFFARTRAWGSDSEAPVFVVGLPRSGTTLIEQILASHPRVFGAGETTLANESFMTLPSHLGWADDPWACVARIDRAGVAGAAEAYLERLRGIGGGAARVVDKMPENYVNLGYVAALFPRAKIIHCRRNVRDIALSCWMTHFTKIRWADDPRHFAAHVVDYRRVMDHWRKVLPLEILDVDYEATVADLEPNARRLVARCDLEWDAACLAFHETKRPVRTASAAQVRQPVHRRSVERWRNYAAELADWWQDDW